MDLSELRVIINQIDAELVPLFCKRMGISLEVAKYKKENGIPVLDKKREAELLARVKENAGDELAPYANALYSTILELSRSYQHRYMNDDHSLSGMILDAKEKTPADFPTQASVACQGVSGAYSEQACKKLFEQPDITFYPTFGSVFEAITAGECKYGLLPIENSIAGSVNQVYDLLKKHKCYIVRSVKLKVSHCLLAKKGTSMGDIKKVFSHEQALNQCSDYIAANGFEPVVCKNTAVAAQMVADSADNSIAAIASPLCCELYGLDALEYDVQNYKNNYTRFICIAKEPEIYPEASQASFMMTLPHVEGSLYSVLSRFYSLGLNLLKLESRPLPETDFEFMFYFDVGCVDDHKALYALCDELSATLPGFAYLGSYSEVK